ncbi:MAG: aldose 1-epimerase family protein [Treponema sp.]|nr:aldose 1-epimerase family protein [Treponema sp.]
MNYTIENGFFTAEISSFGAEIQSLKRKSDSADIIWHGDTSVWKNHAPILFPFVARCLGGYFMIDGKKCEYSRNHGFARDLESKVIEVEKDKIVFELTQSEDTLYRFPYNFSLKTEYALTKDGLNWKITVKNTDSRAFKFSVGTHAAFKCPNINDGTSFTDYEIAFEKEEKLTSVLCTPDGYIACDKEGKLPVKKAYNEEKAGIIPLTGEGFGNGHLFTDFNSEWVGLRNKKNGSTVKISTKGFPYCMIWQNTSGPAQFVCIEPWHGIPDAENTSHIWDEKAGLIELKPGSSFESIQNISIE